MGRDIVEILSLFIGVAFAALLVGHPSGSSQVIGALSDALGKNLATIELAGGYAGNSGIMSGYGNPFSN